MDWAHEFVEGNTRAACSVCGCSRRFPDNLTYCDDKLFRCERCMEETPQARDRKIQSYRASAREEVDLGAGLLPRGEIPSTFLATAQARQAQLIPGWTPTTTFYDDFTIVPGGVGSSWTVAVTGTGSVALADVGVARFSAPASADSARAYVTSVDVPDQSVGNFYCAFQFAISSGVFTTSNSDAVGGAAVGATNSSSEVIGHSSFASKGFFWLQASRARGGTPVELDYEYHVAELWWKTGGAVFGSIDGCPSVFASHVGSGTRDPFLRVSAPGGPLQGVTPVMDVTDYVAMV